MPYLTKQAVQSIKHAYENRSNRVTYNKTWEYLNQHYNVGKRTGKSLQLADADWKTVVAVVLHDTGIDLNKSLPAGLRTDVAATAIEEKWASDRISNYRLFAASNLPIKLQGGVISPVPGNVSWIDYRKIVLAPSQGVVVIENLEAIAEWHRFKLPEDIMGALAIYRGHDYSAKAALKYLTTLPQSHRVISFPDFDPAGFAIANSIARIDALLVPKNPTEISAFTHTIRFEKQWMKYSQSGNEMPDFWKPLWQWMASEQIAIPQESMAARAIQLECVARL